MYDYKITEYYKAVKTPYGKSIIWRVKTQHGIETFSTKKAAEEYARAAEGCLA